MPSYSQQFAYRCAGCGHEGRQQVWLAVDIRERPDLAALIASGAATAPRCESCGRPVTVDGYPSLLVRRPDLRPPLLFATAVQVDQDRMIQQFQMALLMLRHGDQAASGHQQEVQILPYELMPLVADRDVETDLEALAGGTLRAFTAPMQHYRAWLAELARERESRRVFTAVNELLGAPDAASWRRVVLANPVLLTDDADLLMTHLIDETERAGEPAMATQARHCLVLLRKSREFGIDRVMPEQPPPRREQPATLPEVVTQAVGMVLGVELRDEGRPVSQQARRNLLTEALLNLPERAENLAVEWRPSRLLPIRDLLTWGLATELVTHPADRLDLIEAIRRYEQLDHLREALPELWGEVQNNMAVAHTLLADGRDLEHLHAARAAFERALTARTRDADPDGWAGSLAGLATLLYRDYPSTDSGPADEATVMLAEAVADPPDGISARPLLNLRAAHAGALLKGAHRGDDALLTAALGALRRLWEERAGLDDPELKGVVATNYGHALVHAAERTGRPEDRRRVLELARAAREHATAQGDDRLWVQTSGNLGDALYQAGEFAEAETVLREAVDRCGRAGLHREWVNLQGHLARVLLDRDDGDHDEHVAAALGLLTRAGGAVDRDADPGNWAWITGMLAQAYEEAGQPAKAVELLRAAIEAMPRHVDPMRWAQRVRSLANRLPPAEALDWFGQAAQVLTRERYPHDWASIQHNAGMAHRDLALETGSADHLATAIGCMRDALAVRPPDQAPVEWAQTARLLAGTLLRHDGSADAVAEAQRLLTRALPLARDGGRARDVLWAASELGNALAVQGRWAEAVGPFREALDVRDRMYAAGLLRRSREESLAQGAELPIAAAYAMVRAGLPDAAVQALELGRVRLLGDALDRDTAGLENAPEAYLAAVRDLAAAEAAAARLADRAGTDDDAFLRDAEQAVREELRRSAAAYRQARATLPEPPPPAPEPAGHATVYVMASRTESVLLLIGPDGVTSARCPGFHDGMLRRFVHGDGERPGLLDDRSGLNACLQAVGRYVTAPLAALLRETGATRVTLIPVGLFCALPLHAAPDGDGRCLLDEFAVSYAPSRTVRDAARRLADQRAGDRQRRGVAVADPAAGLPFAGYEARMMLDFTGGGQPVTGSAAQVLDAFGDATHIHFACHGLSLVDQPLRSHLDLGGGARLALVDLLAADPGQRPRRARLVVASACQTATVETARNPDEFVGLPAGFLTAGIPCFLGTLWPADDLPTALLGTRFYELLFDEGQPADEALRGAQRWLRDATGATLLAFFDDHPVLSGIAAAQRRVAARFPAKRFYDDPAVWSPYVLIGAPIQEGPRSSDLSSA